MNCRYIVQNAQKGIKTSQTIEFKALFTTPRYRTIEEVIAANNPPRRGRKKKVRE